DNRRETEEKQMGDGLGVLRRQLPEQRVVLQRPLKRSFSSRSMVMNRQETSYLTVKKYGSLKI
ncbi:hypothetical protein, partial [Xanthomonas oryzae]|uniref:hypothetical protein n=1 Tax=Xanthomonas oryzae TaxID=347 RepID=UPI001C49DE52